MVKMRISDEATLRRVADRAGQVAGDMSALDLATVVLSLGNFRLKEWQPTPLVASFMNQVCEHGGMKTDIYVKSYLGG